MTEPVVFDTPIGKIPGLRNLPHRTIKLDLSKVPQVAVDHPDLYWEAVDLLKKSVNAWVSAPSSLHEASRQSDVDERVKEFDEAHPGLFGVSLYSIISSRVIELIMQDRQKATR